MTFLGIDNVVNAEAIVGKDGMADGFKIYYLVKREYYVGKKKYEKMVEKVATKYIREYKEEIQKKKVAKKTSVNLEVVSRILRGK